MKHVLIIDDDACHRELLASVMQTDGYRVSTAGNGVQGMAAMSGFIPDLVLLDMKMPGMDGPSVLAQMRQSERLARVPVVMLTCIADRARIAAAVKLRISGYLLKAQFSMEALTKCVHGALAETTGPASEGAQPAPTRPACTEPAQGAVESGPSGPSLFSAAPRATDTIHRERHWAIDIRGGLKGLKPLMTRSELTAMVDACGQLKALAPTVSQVLSLTGNERASIESVSRAIAQDQAIALKVLKLGNSAVFTRGEPLDSVHKAVVRIGIERIRQAVLNLAVIDRFASEAFAGPLDTLQFWEHAIAVGLIAAELAHEESERLADAAFTMGLLHDVGRVIYAEQLGITYIDIIKAAQDLGAPLEQVESRLLLMNHADVMDRVLRAWGFPKELVEPIVHHHLSPANARNAAPKQLSETVRLGLADRLAHALMLGASGNETVYPVAEHCQALRVGGATIRKIEEMARRQTDDVKYAMLSKSSAAPWPQRRDQLRSMLNGPLRIHFVSRDPDTDAYRIFCGNISDPACEQRANLIVAHVPSSRDRAAVSSLVAAADEAHGLREVAAIVLSPGGEHGLDGNAAARDCLRVATPFQVTRFIEAVNGVLAGVSAKAA